MASCSQHFISFSVQDFFDRSARFHTRIDPVSHMKFPVLDHCVRGSENRLASKYPKVDSFRRTVGRGRFKESI